MKNLILIFLATMIVATVSAQHNTLISKTVQVKDSIKLKNKWYKNFADSADLAFKQNTLTAGANISIVGNTISASGGGGAYTAGTGIDITTNKISSQDTFHIYSNPLDYGAIGNGVANDQTAVQNAINNSKSDYIYLEAGRSFLVASISNPNGKIFIGGGRILNEANEQLNTYADTYKSVFGEEYLYAYHNYLRTKTATGNKEIVFSGESTISDGMFITNFNTLLSLNQVLNTPTVNAGYPSNSTRSWLNTHLVTDLARANMNCYVLRWGINDSSATMTLRNYRTGLAQIRASKSVSQLSVVLMSPNSTYDITNYRDRRKYDSINIGLRQLAREFLCTYIDIYGQLNDSKNGVGLWMNDDFGDGRTVHPKEELNRIIADKTFDVLIPKIYRSNGGLVSNLIQKTATEAPSTYPLGVSLYRSGSGFPMDALVRTTRGQYTGDAMQENIPMGGGFGNINQGYYVRFGTFSNGTWGAWQYVGPTPKATNPESLYTSVTTGSTTPIPGSGDGTIIKNANGFFGWDATTGIWVKLNN